MSSSKKSHFLLKLNQTSKFYNTWMHNLLREDNLEMQLLKNKCRF